MQTITKEVISSDGDSGAIDTDTLREEFEQLSLRDLARHSGLSEEEIDAVFPLSDVGKIL